MSFDMADPTPELDDSTACGGAVTPPETVTDLLENDCPSVDLKESSSVPWPGSTFIIRSVSSGRVVTLVEGRIELAPPGGRGSIHWACVQKMGHLKILIPNTFAPNPEHPHPVKIGYEMVLTLMEWLGFRNPVSGRYLGYCGNGKLRCEAGKQKGWEDFCVRLTPEGGYVLLMTHDEKLWYVGSVNDHGMEKLAKVSERVKDAIVWEFVKV
ncbi:hypothetical protein B2J93_8426 [Marssonina coronariae]|uniref:Uncharacterized protein n=1 Tax=Diplocarpon coronariae TaxID=2795749 RepID=A0A218Z0B1_9HELO|nr:hypothetical protein B2J93_8426 [Marssonina coronariae]